MTENSIDETYLVSSKMYSTLKKVGVIDEEGNVDMVKYVELVEKGVVG